MIKKHSKILVIILCFSLIITFSGVHFVQGGAIADLFGIKDDTGGLVTDNIYDYLGIGKISDWGTASGEVFTNTGKGASILKYRPERAAELTKYGSKLARLSNYLRGFGQVLNVYNTSVDTYKLFTETSKHDTTVGKVIDKGLLATDVGMGWYAVGAGFVALITAPAWGPGVVAAAGATGTTYLVGKIGVGVTRIVFNSQTSRDVLGFLGGTKKLTFTPFNRPGMKEGLDIIKDELGFDLYPGLRREIPDPSTGIPVYKPNIYLYSKKDMMINVKLYPSHWITISDPLYPIDNGWTASIEDGSLNGTEDFLFYEAIVPDEGFQKDSGWRIKANTHNQDMVDILNNYGFNDTEIKDFTNYWLSILDKDKSYLFLPQLNIEIDMIMPLIVSPTPDNIYRIWFYIIPDNGENIKEPIEQLSIERDGFTVVEWGGILP